MEIKNVIWADAKWDVCYFKFIDNKLRSVVFETSNQQLSDSELVELKNRFVEGVTSIGFAFHGCTNLKTITLPVGVKKIYDNFRGCESIEAIYVPAKKADYYKKRLPEELHQFIVEMEPVKKAKK